MPFCYCNFLEQQHDEIPKKVYCGRLSANIVEVESTTDHCQKHTFQHIRVSCKPYFVYQLIVTQGCSPSICSN